MLCGYNSERFSPSHISPHLPLFCFVDKYLHLPFLFRFLFSTLFLVRQVISTCPF